MRVLNGVREVSQASHSEVLQPAHRRRRQRNHHDKQGQTRPARSLAAHLRKPSELGANKTATSDEHESTDI